MKRSFDIFSGLCSLMILGALALPASAADTSSKKPQNQSQSQQGQMQGQSGPDLLVIEVIPDTGMGAAPNAGGAVILTKGKLTGEVVNVDKQKGTIDIKNEKGIVNSFNLEGPAKNQLDHFKKGDKVDLVLNLQAVDVSPQGQGGTSGNQG